MTTATFVPSCFFLRSDVVVIGSNPESADMDNPRGSLFGYAVYVVAEASNGERMAHDHTFTASREKDALARGEALLARIQAAVFGHGRDIDPACWTPCEAAYGSNAYVAEVAMMSREERAQ
jgi:hypothetical protein